jgi:hypothetical protein
MWMTDAKGLVRHICKNVVNKRSFPPNRPNLLEGWGIKLETKFDPPKVFLTLNKSDYIVSCCFILASNQEIDVEDKTVVYKSTTGNF